MNTKNTNNNQNNSTSKIETDLDFNFSCTKCGQCCKSAPDLTAMEMFNNSDKFFLQLAHYSIISPEKKQLDNDLLEHYNKFCHCFYLPEQKSYLYYFTSIKAVNRPSTNCPALTSDNLCSLQENKPLFCQNAPLNIVMPENKQISHIKKQWIPIINANEYKCDISSTAKPLIRNNSIANLEDEDNFYGYLLQLKTFTDIFLEPIINNKNDLLLKHHIWKCFKFSESTGSSIFYSSILDILKIMYKNGMCDEDKIFEIINNQINLIDKDIDQALLDKNLKDRNIVKVMRDQVKELAVFNVNELNTEAPINFYSM